MLLTDLTPMLPSDLSLDFQVNGVELGEVTPSWLCAVQPPFCSLRQPPAATGQSRTAHSRGQLVRVDTLVQPLRIAQPGAGIPLAASVHRGSATSALLFEDCNGVRT